MQGPPVLTGTYTCCLAVKGCAYVSTSQAYPRQSYKLPAYQSDPLPICHIQTWDQGLAPMLAFDVGRTLDQQHVFPSSRRASNHSQLIAPIPTDCVCLVNCTPQPTKLYYPASF